MSRSPADPHWRPDRIVVGRLGRPHGLDGAVHLDGHGGVVRLDPGMHVEVGGRPAVILERRGMPERPILRLDIAADRDAVAALRGQDVAVEAAALPDTGEDEYFHVDLIGCAVRSGDRELGTVTDVQSYPANDVLQISPGAGADAILVPFAADVVLGVDLAERLITIRPDFL